MKINHLLMAGLFSFALISSQAAKGTEPTATPPAAAKNTANVTPPINDLSDTQVKQIQKVVHDYLVQNPQVLVEASQAYQDQELAKAKTKTQLAVSKNAKSLFNSAHSPTVGNHNGDVTVIEFLDYQCTHCREMSTVVGGLIKGDGKIRVVIKELPIFGGSSKYAAQASIASMKQGPDKFLAFHKSLLEAAPPLTDQKVMEVAKNAGLNTQQLETDMKSKIVEDQINDNFKLAQALGLLGTPAFIVSNRSGSHVEYVPGAVTIESLKQAITQVRK
ncbi:MAG: DsbA family protein [Gammaproteobacteria bacterium]|nr:DsbA family protein [Gammaproteobacteria bacterium]